jgi:hypothetical protein
VLKPGAAAGTTVIYNIGDINISAGNINTQLDFKKAVQDAIKEMNRRNLLLT